MQDLLEQIGIGPFRHSHEKTPAYQLTARGETRCGDASLGFLDDGGVVDQTASHLWVCGEDLDQESAVSATYVDERGDGREIIGQYGWHRHFGESDHSLVKDPRSLRVAGEIGPEILSVHLAYSVQTGLPARSTVMAILAAWRWNGANRAHRSARA